MLTVLILGIGDTKMHSDVLHVLLQFWSAMFF